MLGALSPEERLEFERHLPGCAACTRAVGQLAGLPGLLAQVSPDVLEHETDPVPETLLPALVREVRRAQHRRRWTVGLVAAVTVVAVGVGTAAVVSVTGDDTPSQAALPQIAAPQEMAQVGQTSVLGELSLTSVGWGTRLDLTCSYDDPAGYHDETPHSYALVVHTRDGGRRAGRDLEGPARPDHAPHRCDRPDVRRRSGRSRCAPTTGQPVLELSG